ncbi:DUF420 domain-containing protein [Sporocytophaga myxococcoides]|uniref:DUF420 domain-containing protein n=1 Tax=Sporocytophaga myxococcoides TaxID=153721 RepID=UPI00041FC07D|nr:DUF420 domain-containing protein [Sporocytophaga myxococcoides]
MNTQINPVIEKKDNLYLIIIGILSVAVPVLVSVLFYLPQTGKLGDLDVSFLPHLNAVLNTCTTIALLSGFYFIKFKKDARLHRMAMMVAFCLSSLFLISYVIYHYQGPHTIYGDINHDGVLDIAEKSAVGIWRTIYILILVPHIILAAVVVPFVLFAIYFGISNQFSKHVKVVKWTFPIWLYVAVTGVIVYLMISPYYGA